MSMQDKKIIASITHDRAVIVKAIRFSSKEKRDYARTFALSLTKIMKFILAGDWESAKKHWHDVELNAIDMIDAISLADRNRFTRILAELRNEVFSPIHENTDFAVLAWQELMSESNMGYEQTAQKLDKNLILNTKADQQLMEKDTQMVNELEFWQRKEGSDE